MAYLPTPQETPWQRSDDIDVSRTALIVVDVLGGSSPVNEALQSAVSNCVDLANACRSAGIAVIFADDAHIPGLDKELELWGDHGIAGTDDARPLDAFMVSDSDFVIPKRRYDAFFQTDLDMTLRELGVDTLIVCGMDTNICVLQTLAGAYFRCYKTIVPADATATFLIGTQESGLEYFTRCYDSRVTTTAAVIDRLK